MAGAGGGMVVYAAPSPIAPGQIPACLCWQSVGDEIKSGRSPGMATQQPRQCHPSASPQAETLDRLVGVFGAAGKVSAAGADQPRQRVAVKPNHAPSKQARGVAGGFDDVEHVTRPRIWPDLWPPFWPQSVRWRPRRRQRSAWSRRAAPCSRAPVRAPRYRPTCRSTAAHRFP